MADVIDADYSQMYLLPVSLKNWVGPTHPARFIREFVDALALHAVGIEWAAGEVVQCNDLGQLNAMIAAVEAQARSVAERTVAGAGYATGPELARAEQDKRDVVVALPAAMRPNSEAPFHAGNFTYDAARNCCICPTGGILTYRHTRVHHTKGYQLRLYRCTVATLHHRVKLGRGGTRPYLCMGGFGSWVRISMCWRWQCILCV